MPTRRLLSLILVFVAPALFARGLEKYKNWPDSPQGYFMTSAERAEWKAKVHTDAEAEEFVKKFVASRGAGFADEVAKRAAIADQRLTVAGRAGSLTTRGKIVILLGPPSSFAIAQRGASHGHYSTPQSPSHSAATSVGGSASPGGGQSVEDVMDAIQHADLSSSTVTIYTFTYAADRLPGKQSKDLIVEVEADPGNGSDRIADRKVAAQLDEVFEQAAEAQLAAAKPAAPAPKP